jgi:hypothetical protein
MLFLLASKVGAAALHEQQMRLVVKWSQDDVLTQKAGKARHAVCVIACVWKVGCVLLHLLASLFMLANSAKRLLWAYLGARLHLHQQQHQQQQCDVQHWQTQLVESRCCKDN